MKKKNAIAFTMCVVLLFGGIISGECVQTVVAQEGSAHSSKMLYEMSGKEIICDLKDKLNNDESVDIGLYVALIIKLNSDEVIQLVKKEINNGKNSEVTQTMFYDILNHLSVDSISKNVEEMKAYLDNKNVCMNVKARIINEWMSSKEDADFLDKKVDGKDKEIAYYSLKRLYELDEEKGSKRAFKLLNKSANSTNKKVDIARYIISDMVRNATDYELKKAWIEKSISWMNKTKNSDIRRKWVYALSFMNDKRALDAIVKNKKVTIAEKQCALYENKNLIDTDKGMTLKMSATDSIGKLGCAVFRDGVLVTEWHAAIVTTQKPRVKVNKSGNIIHATGPNTCVKRDSWNNFLDGYQFKGFFKANVGTTKEKRILISEMAKKLATYDIPYCFLDMMQVKKGVKSNNILPEYISALRCDGLVEYCYEYYGLRLQGNEEHWDITANTKVARRAHSMLYSWVSPKRQSICMRMF